MQLRYENRAAPATAALLFVALIVQCLGSMRLKSPTYDEPLYMASGFVALTQGVELTPEHAPLMKYLIAVPLILVGSSSAPSIPLWDQATTSPRTYSLAFLFNNRIDPDRLLFAGRTAVVFVSVLLATLVWVWSRQLYGPWPANVALGFYVFNPDIIAHSTLAMLDLGSTAGIAAASYAIWRAYKVPSATRAVAAGAVLAVALLMKSTGLLLLALLPLYLCAAIAHLEQHPSALTPAGDWNATMRSKRGSSWQPMSVTAIALFTAAVLVAVAYGPHRFGLVAYAESFRRGFLQRDTLMNREYEAFAWGRYSKTGFAWYFLAAFILKAPIPMLVGVVATIIWLACRGASKNFDEFFLALPVLAFFVTTTFVIDDIGIRYILPVYPMVFILISGMTGDLYRWACAESVRRRQLAALGGVAAVVYIGGALWIYPDYLAFFNGIFCGPGNGIRYLDDSNIDIGQDFKQLATYVLQHDIGAVTGFYHPLAFTPYVAHYYGINFTLITPEEIRRPRPGWYAISAHILQRPSLSNEPGYRDLRFDWLDRYQPVVKIGYLIYLYHFDELAVAN